MFFALIALPVAMKFLTTVCGTIPDRLIEANRAKELLRNQDKLPEVLEQIEHAHYFAGGELEEMEQCGNGCAIVMAKARATAAAIRLDVPPGQALEDAQQLDESLHIFRKIHQRGLGVTKEHEYARRGAT